MHRSIHQLIASETSRDIRHIARHLESRSETLAAVALGISITISPWVGLKVTRRWHGASLGRMRWSGLVGLEASPYSVTNPISACERRTSRRRPPPRVTTQEMCRPICGSRASRHGTRLKQRPSSIIGYVEVAERFAAAVLAVMCWTFVVAETAKVNGSTSRSFPTMSTTCRLRRSASLASHYSCSATTPAA